MKKILATAAILMIATVIIFNVSPGLSYAAADIPILSDIVRVVTFGRYEVSDNGYEAHRLRVPPDGSDDHSGIVLTPHPSSQRAS